MDIGRRLAEQARNGRNAACIYLQDILLSSFCWRNIYGSPVSGNHDWKAIIAVNCDFAAFVRAETFSWNIPHPDCLNDPDRLPDQRLVALRQERNFNLDVLPSAALAFSRDAASDEDRGNRQQ